MNCKPGELCRVIAPGPYQDMLVTVTHMADLVFPTWFIETPIPSKNGGYQYWFFDRVLRPIRWSNDPDQTLQWLDVPSAEKVDA